MDFDKIIRDAGVMWQHKREWRSFLELLHFAKVKSVLEIGTGLGGSAYCFGEVTGHGRVVTVDFDGAGAARINPARRRKQPNPNFVQVTGDSRTDEVQAQVAAYGPFDLVYFDTEHPYDNCVDNYARYASMANRFIAQHDIAMDEVHWPDAGIPRYWREFSAPYRVVGNVREIVDPDPDPRFPRWGGIGVIQLV